VRIAGRTFAAYAVMLVAAALALAAILGTGASLDAPAPPLPALAPRGVGHASVLVHVLGTLAAVIALGQGLAWVFARLGQPPVIGEVVAGILLGPSLIGVRASQVMLPPEAAPFLEVVAQLGIVLYMFLVGLGLDATPLRRRAHTTVAISHAGIVVPFVLGAWLALWLYPRVSTSDVPFPSFALFMGVAMSITAFPVLARILTDRRLARTTLGTIALACAAIDDVTAWCLLAVVAGVARAQLGGAVAVVGGALAYVGGMLLVVRPLVARTVARLGDEELSRGTVALVFVVLLCSTLVAESIGIHAVFGAFLVGAIIPHESAVARTFTGRFESLVVVLFLPAFFAFTGMRTRIDLVTTGTQWLACALVVLVATVGKFGGTLAAGRLTGLGWRDAAALGVLMNTRGLMELIVLNVGLDLGVVSPPLFAMMVLMALATTLGTSPILRRVLGGAARDTSGETAGARA
jgi:K+:H+ antiporter